MKRFVWKLLTLLVLLCVGYFSASLARYRFQHPELTNTQLFLRIPDAMTWR